MASFWESVVSLVLRPERSDYRLEDLGPTLFSIGGRAYERADFNLLNRRDQRLSCSWFRPPSSLLTAKMPCVVYAHGNSGSRVDALEVVESLLPAGVMVVAGDLSGSGKSEGSVVTLGVREQEDVEDLVAYLRATGVVSTVSLWGRSMGAVTSIFVACQESNNITSIVLDSPFSSLEDVIRDVVFAAKPWIPRPALRAAIAALRASVRKRAGFNLSTDLDVRERAARCQVPALFLHGKDDDFVGMHHSEALREVYAGDSNLRCFDGDHNSDRPEFIMISATAFLVDTIARAGGFDAVTAPPQQPHPPAEKERKREKKKKEKRAAKDLKRAKPQQEQEQEQEQEQDPVQDMIDDVLQNVILLCE
jgi:pimeloyl-ACP methyl ester carboxylesterase